MDTKQILIQAGNHVAEGLSKIDPAQVDAMAKGIAKANRVFVSGWGRAGNVAGILGMDMSQVGKLVYRVGAMIAGDEKTVLEDIGAVVDAAHPKAIVKVILENCLLTDAQKTRACELCVQAGAEFVKTSTGFSTGGATAEDVALMKKAVAGKAKVKAAGGIRTKEDALAMIEAGADRIGASAGIAIVTAE